MAWYLPQHELPGKDLVSGPQLYARRERAFLVLVVVFVAASAALPLLGFTRLYGVTSLVRRAFAPPAPLLVPLGAFAFPLALLALSTVNALYGKRRAWALVFASLLVWSGIAALHYGTDHVLAYDGPRTAAFLPGVALVACTFVTCGVQIEVFALLRRSHVLRGAVSSLVGLAAGWGVTALIVRSAPVPLAEDITGIALAAAGASWAFTLAGTIVLAPVTRALALHLRFPLRAPVAGDFEDEPAFTGRKRRAEIIDSE